MELYQQAHEIDPYDPSPLYQSGMALLELGCYTEARKTYEEVERLAPGWFHCRFDYWLAGQLEEGLVPQEVLYIWRVLADGGELLQKLESIEKVAVEQFPNFAPFWWKNGDYFRNQGNYKEAEIAYRNGLEVVEDPETESHLLVSLAGIFEKNTNEKRELIDRCLSLKGNLTAIGSAQIMKKML